MRDPASAPPRWVRIVGVSLLLASSIVVGVVLAEVGLRQFQPQIFPVHSQGMYVPNALYGTGLTPNFVGRFQRAEFDASFRINSAGFRGPELRPRQDNTVRIVALGDSQTFGFGVLDHETYAVQLEQLLSRFHPELDIQVTNTGSPRYGTYHQLNLLRSRWEELDPDLVLLQFLPVNDFQDNREAVRQLHPQVRDGMLISPSAAPDDVPRPAWVRVLYWSKSQFHLARLLSESAGYLSMRLGMAQHVDALWGEDFSDDDAVLTQELLEQVATTAHRGGARALFLYSTAKTAMMGSTYVVPRSRAVLQQAAQNTGAMWVDLNELMREHERPHRFYFVRDGHWSPAGHRVIAEILASRIVDLSLLSTDPGAGPATVPVSSATNDKLSVEHGLRPILRNSGTEAR